MSFMEVLLNAWICDRCGIEVLVGDDLLPGGWQVHPSGAHACAVCARGQS